jgi:hypothetical protein
MRKLLLAGFLGVAIAVTVLLSPLFRRPDTFSPDRSVVSFRKHPEWDILPLSSIERQKLVNVLSQPFHYLADGSQSFVFASEDGKYVIKFFRIKRLVPKLIHSFRPKKIANRQRNLHLLFNAYKLAYERFRQEAGLLFIHLNPSNHLKITLHVQDRKKKEHAINLDEVQFVVQEKAEILHHRLGRLKAEKKFEELQKATSAFLSLVKYRIDAGITDLDKTITINYGFVGDRPVQIDVGRICVGQQLGEYDRISALLYKMVQQL